MVRKQEKHSHMLHVKCFISFLFIIVSNFSSFFMAWNNEPKALEEKKNFPHINFSAAWRSSHTACDGTKEGSLIKLCLFLGSREGKSTLIVCFLTFLSCFQRKWQDNASLFLLSFIFISHSIKTKRGFFF